MKTVKPPPNRRGLHEPLRRACCPYTDPAGGGVQRQACIIARCSCIGVKIPSFGGAVKSRGYHTAVMKVGIVGAGRVGQACTMALMLRDVARQIVLVNRTRERARGVITDMQYGAPVVSSADLRDGEYPDLAGASLVMIAAGVNEKSGGATNKDDPEGRLRLLDKNVETYRNLVPQIVKAAPEALLLILTDPPDPLADLARKLAGHDRVHVARRLGVSPRSVDAWVLGEHGKSAVFIWSALRVGELPLGHALKARRVDERDFRSTIELEVRDANITIIEGNDASQFGIGMVSARLAEIVLRDELEIVPVGSYVEHYGVTLSLPALLGRDGIVQRFEPGLSEEEQQGLERSAEVLKKAVERAGITRKVS
jgi:L-lactate dehydrogenase